MAPELLQQSLEGTKQGYHAIVVPPGTGEPSDTPFHPACDEEHIASYGYGTVSWKKSWRLRKGKYEMMTAEPSDAETNDAGRPDLPDLPAMDEARQPLSRKVPIASSLINPYRMAIVLRVIALAFYFRYRILNPVVNAYELWLTSVICEICFAVFWLVNELPKWSPVRRETYLDRLALRYKRSCDLPAIDVYIITEDPILSTANAVLSILSLDYPVEKLSCYVSDDSGAMLTFEGLSETSEFARKWVPFCKRFNVEPSAPEVYFGQKIDYSSTKFSTNFVKERRAMKREYEEFKVRINGLVEKATKMSEEWKMEDGTPWPGVNSEDHPGMIQVFLGHSGGHDSDGNELPRLVYVSRERRPGFKHHKKAGALNALVRVSAVLTNAPYIVDMNSADYVNNSSAIREAMCFMMDTMVGRKTCFVQFPQRFVGTDGNDLFFDVHLKGLDGVQGPIYVGRGCVIRREALYGLSAPVSHIFCGSDACNVDKRYGQSPIFIASTYKAEDDSNPEPSILLKEAIHVISCGYEDKTDWGKEIGWIYRGGESVTGLLMHVRGWRSTYCMPQSPAFKTCGSVDIASRMEQSLVRAVGSVELVLSRHSPVWYGYGGRMKWLQRLGYLSSALYPLISLPLVTYCTLPAVCLFTGKFIIPELGSAANSLILAMVICMGVSNTLEMRWSGVNVEEWWRDEQLWVITGVSAQLIALFQGLVKTVGGSDSCALPCGLLRTTAWSGLVVFPLTILALNVVGVASGLSDILNNGYSSWGPLLGKLLFALWVVLHLYPFLKAIMARRNRTPTIVLVWSILLASIFSLMWVRVNPFIPKLVGPSLEECGINC